MTRIGLVGAGRQGLHRRRRIRLSQPGGLLASEATAYWKANTYSGSGDLVDLSGNGHHARLGSAAGSDTNDPLWLPYEGRKYVYLTTTSGNGGVRTPDSPSLSVTGDMELILRVNFPTFAPSATQYLASQWFASPNNAWRLAILTSGALFWGDTANGSTNIYNGTLWAAMPTTLSVNTWYWLRVTVDVDNGSGNREIRAHWAADSTTVPTSWTSTTGVLNSASTANTANVTNDVAVGSFSNGSSGFDGKISHFIMRNGIGGTTAAAFNADNATEPYTTVTDSVGNVWTFNRAATGRKLTVVDRPMFLLGTDDYFEVADHANLDFAATDSFTVAVAARIYGTATSGTFVAKRDTGLSINAGYALALSAANVVRARVADGVVESSDTQAFSSGVAHTLVGRRSVAADTIAAFTDGASDGSTADGTTLTSANALPLRFGAGSQATPATFLDGEFIGAAVIRRALTDAEVTQLHSELLS